MKSPLTATRHQTGIEEQGESLGDTDTTAPLEGGGDLADGHRPLTESVEDLAAGIAVESAKCLFQGHVEFQPARMVKT